VRDASSLIRVNHTTTGARIVAAGDIADDAR
jgi:hypothetical protein